jgi:hypothetical protein
MVVQVASLALWPPVEEVQGIHAGHPIFTIGARLANIADMVRGSLDGKLAAIGMSSRAATLNLLPFVGAPKMGARIARPLQFLWVLGTIGVITFVLAALRRPRSQNVSGH